MGVSCSITSISINLSTWSLTILFLSRANPILVISRPSKNSLWRICLPCTWTFWSYYICVFLGILPHNLFNNTPINFCILRCLKESLVLERFTCIVIFLNLIKHAFIFSKDGTLSIFLNKMINAIWCKTSNFNKEKVWCSLA